MGISMTVILTVILVSNWFSWTTILRKYHNSQVTRDQSTYCQSLFSLIRMRVGLKSSKRAVQIPSRWVNSLSSYFLQFLYLSLNPNSVSDSPCIFPWFPIRDSFHGKKLSQSPDLSMCYSMIFEDKLSLSISRNTITHFT